MWETKELGSEDGAPNDSVGVGDLSTSIVGMFPAPGGPASENPRKCPPLTAWSASPMGGRSEGPDDEPFVDERICCWSRCLSWRLATSIDALLWPSLRGDALVGVEEVGGGGI